jgi:hypothetical protein
LGCGGVAKKCVIERGQIKCIVLDMMVGVHTENIIVVGIAMSMIFVKIHAAIDGEKIIVTSYF